MKILEPSTENESPTVTQRRAARTARRKVARLVRASKRTAKQEIAQAAYRVTVRLKPTLAARLAAVQKQQGGSVTKIVEAALEKHLPEVRRKPKMTLLGALKKHGLLGAVDMGPDASTNYKDLVADSVAQKYGYR